MKLKLSNIQFIIADCVDNSRVEKAATIMNYYVTPYKTTILTDKINIRSKFEYIKIDTLRSQNEYSNFMLKELYKYVETDHFLIFQWDGFILNPKAWTDDFLKYDYIGSPWKVYSNIGQNGGFSLRSKRLHNYIAKQDYGINYHEDQIICLNTTLRKKFKFAPLNVASKFSEENGQWKDSFGFHDFRCTDLINWKDKDKFLKR